MIDFTDDIDEVKPDDAKLGRLGELANKQVELEKEVLEAEDNLKQIKKKLAVVAERDIPELMAEIGLESIETKDGKKITVKEILTASISKERKPKAIEWLVNNELDSLITANVVVSFDKGDRACIELTEKLASQGFLVNMDENVNTSSVKAAIKEMLENGDNVPLDLFGANIVKKSIVK